MSYAIVCTICAITVTHHRNSRNDEFPKVLYRFDAENAGRAAAIESRCWDENELSGGFAIHRGERRSS